MLDDYTRLTVGQLCPVSKIELVSGEEFMLLDMTPSSPFLILFIIVNCPHCRKAMRYIENQIKPDAGDTIKCIAIGRNHTAAELLDVPKLKKWSPLVAVDPERSVYDLFAEKKVPRIYLFNSAGELIHQVRGFMEEEYGVLKEVVMEMVGDSGRTGLLR